MSEYFNFHEYVADDSDQQGAYHSKSNTSLEFKSNTNSEATVSGNEGGLSSSSSFGWSDEFSEEYESSTRTKLYEELLLMDKILKCETFIPPHYDKDEYDQWMHRFPSLSVLDRCETPVNSPLFRQENGNPNLMIHRLLRKGCDVNNSPKGCERKIHEKSHGAEYKKITAVSNNGYILDTEKDMEICGKKSNITRRKHSEKCMSTKHLPIFKFPLEHDSLPIIESRKLPSDNVNKKPWNILPRSLDREDPDHLVLPPIITKNYFRSISATPRQYYKAFSALSMKSNIIVNNRKDTNTCLYKKKSFH